MNAEGALVLNTIINIKKSSLFFKIRENPIKDKSIKTKL